MRGNLLESYCALAKADCYLELAKADCYLELERNERNERKVDNLREKIHYIQREVYNLGGEE